MFGDFFTRSDLLESILQLVLDALIHGGLLVEALATLVVLIELQIFDAVLQLFVTGLELSDLFVKHLDFLVCVVLAVAEHALLQCLLKEALVASH